jgi:hypothetical protein
VLEIRAILREHAAIDAHRLGPALATSRRGAPADFAVQPCLRKAPISHHRIRRDLEYVRSLGHGETAEEPQLDGLTFPGVDGC